MSNWDDKDSAAIRRTAELIVGRHADSQTVVNTLENEFHEVAQYVPSSGGVGYVKWCAAMQSLGEIITSIAKRETKKARAMGMKL